MATASQQFEENAFAAPVPRGGSSGMIAVAQQREIAEVQSKMIIARMNPRDEKRALDRILQACTRPTLAESALYSYNRGGADVTGPSIRLAEVLAQNWQNFDFGIRELEQRDGESSVEAYAWDVENNVSQRKTFQVAHIRYSKNKGNVKLSDPRDIYEMVANQGARRMRACILGVIPGDVIEAATKQCEVTLKSKAEVTPERLKSLVEKFGEFNVTKEMIEARIQRHLEAMTPALLVQMGKIYNSLKDGMSAPSDWFTFESKAGGESGALNLADLKPGKHAQEAPGTAAPASAATHKAEAAKPQPASSGKGKPGAGKATASSTPLDRQGYAAGADPDPMLGENLFQGREPGEEG